MSCCLKSARCMTQFRCTKTQLNWDESPKCCTQTSQDSGGLQETTVSTNRGQKHVIKTLRLPAFALSPPPSSRARPRALPVSCRGAFAWHLAPPTAHRRTLYPCKWRPSRGDCRAWGGGDGVWPLPLCLSVTRLLLHTFTSA